MPSIKDSHNELIGTRYLAQLPEGGKRAYQIMHVNPPLIQDLKTVAKRFEKAVNSADSVTIATGFPVRGTFETDGPIGAFILGNFLLQQGFSVNITSEPELLNAMTKFPWEVSGISHLSFIPTPDLKKISEVFISIKEASLFLSEIFNSTLIFNK